MSIRAGRLQHKVEILQKTTVRDETNQPVPTYTSKGFAWAAVRAVTGKEKLVSGQGVQMRAESASINYFMEIRYDGDLKITDKIKYNGYQHDIISMAPRGRNNRETIEVMTELLNQSELEK